MITVWKVMAKMGIVNKELFLPSEDAGTRELKLNYQASYLKPEEVIFFTQCIFKLQICLLPNFMAVKIINRFKK